MNRVCRGILIMVVLMGVSIVVFAVNKVIQHLFATEGYACEFDNRISDSHKCVIFNFMNKDKKLRYCSAGCVCKKVKRQFGVVKMVQACKRPDGILRLCVQVFEPKFVINNTHVIAENSVLFDKNLFSESVLRGCGCMRVEGFDGTLCDTCKRMIFGLPKYCFKQYEIVRESEIASWMCDKGQKGFKILFSDELFPDKVILGGCEKLKQELACAGQFEVSKRRVKTIPVWIADVRFKEQIVLSNEIGGR